MATSVLVNGKVVKRPGVYATTKSGIKYPPQNQSYGNICIIDTGLGKGFAGGAGVLGSLSQGSNSVYELQTLQQYREFMKGGILQDLGEVLFKPFKSNIPGVAKVFFVKACESTCGEISLNLTNGTVVFQTLDEGVGVNGVLKSGELVSGYACKVVKSTVDSSKFVIQFYHGNFAGIDATNNIPYLESEDNSKGEIFLSTPQLKTIEELIAWCKNSNEFKNVFKLKPGHATSGEIVAQDVTNTPGYRVATGGTENYTNTAFDKALKAVKDIDNTFFLALDYGNEGVSLNNEKILDFITNESKYEKFLVVAGGFDKTSFLGSSNTSEAVAKNFNSDKVIVVHGGYEKNTRNGVVVKTQLHKAALVLGRLCGLTPQTPITFKGVNIDSEIHKMDDDEKETALDFGILTTHYDHELDYHVVQQGINSLQKNNYLVNEDGSSHDIAVRRITAQLNKEIAINAKKTFFGKDQTGPNRNTVTEEDISAWLQGFLQTKTASSLEDNLIVKFGDIVVTVEADNYFVNYSFVPNYPISKMIFTGTLLER